MSVFVECHLALLAGFPSVALTPIYSAEREQGIQYLPNTTTLWHQKCNIAYSKLSKSMALPFLYYKRNKIVNVDVLIITHGCLERPAAQQHDVCQLPNGSPWSTVAKHHQPHPSQQVVKLHEPVS